MTSEIRCVVPQLAGQLSGAESQPLCFTLQQRQQRLALLHDMLHISYEEQCVVSKLASQLSGAEAQLGASSSGTVVHPVTCYNGYGFTQCDVKETMCQKYSSKALSKLNTA